MRRLFCFWDGHRCEPWDIRWRTGETPHRNIWRCRRCGHEAEGRGGGVRL